MNPYLFVVGAGLMAGAMNALAGGGSFITLPALISVGRAVGAGECVEHGRPVSRLGGQCLGVPRWLGTDRSGAAAAAVVGDDSRRRNGCVLAAMDAVEDFDFLLPWLLLIATLTLALGRQIGEALRRRWHIRPPAVLACNSHWVFTAATSAAPSAS